jgi:hypothetical protein
VSHDEREHVVSKNEVVSTCVQKAAYLTCLDTVDAVNGGLASPLRSTWL